MDSILLSLAYQVCSLISLEWEEPVSTRSTESFHVKNEHAHKTVALVGLPSNLRKPTSHLPGKPKQTRFSPSAVPKVETHITSQLKAQASFLTSAASFLEELYKYRP